MRFLLLLFICFIGGAFTLSTITKKDYPQDYFRSPVNKTIRLSGTFGELRPNHFHAGIDIKGKVGEQLFAVADGYVSRIKVQAGSYGNALYINHPNGYTSVYAHLQKFPKAIANYVKQEQYNRNSFDVDLYPTANQFAFLKGEEVGRLGVSGRSFGPHLHFEIRETDSEVPINPLLFGIHVTDTRRPKLHELKVYHLNDKLETTKTQKHNLIDLGKSYKIKGDTLMIAAWRAGFGLKAYDLMNGASNWNGIYSLDVYKDDEPVYNFEMEAISFSETRYINAHLDYEEQVAHKSYFNRCYKLPGNRLSIYKQEKEQGVITLHKGKASKITMVAKDVEGNTSKLEFWVKRAEVTASESPTFNYILPYNEDNIIQNNAFYLFFPKGALYENLYLQYHTSSDKSHNVYSAVHHLNDFKTPIHQYFDIAIQPYTIPEHLRSKAFIAYCGKGNKVKTCGGKWRDGKLWSKAQKMGDYSIMIDDVKPTIKPIHFSGNMNGYSRMSFEIKDNFEAAKNVEYLSFNATVDGRWVLMEYDSKKDLITHKFDGSIEKGEHLLRLEVADSRGNIRVFERTFIR